MDLIVKLFGAEAEAAGRKEIQVAVEPGTTCKQLRGLLATDIPALGPLMPHIRIAVNSEFATDSLTIKPDDDIALIGLVSGG